MNYLLQINKAKILKLLLTNALILLTIILIVFLIAYNYHSLPNKQLMIQILFWGCIIFPIGIVLLPTLLWIQKQKVKMKHFDVLELDKIDFIDKEIKQSKFWTLNEIIKAKKIENYLVQLNISQTNSNVLEAEVPVEWRQINRIEFQLLENKFRPQNIELRIGTIVKQFNIQNLIDDDQINQFEEEILKFINLISVKGFEPKL